MTSRILRAAGLTLCAAALFHVRPAAAQMFPHPTFYIGPVVGGGFGDSHKNFANGQSTGDFNVNGAVGGVTGGFAMHWGRWEVGPNLTFLGTGLSGNTGFRGTVETSNHWLVLLGPRVGMQVFPGITPYITGGMALGDIEVQAPGVDDTKNTHGWNAGAGVTFNLMPGWKLDAQYRHVSLDKANTADFSGAPTSTSFETNLFTTALLFQF